MSLLISTCALGRYLVEGKWCPCSYRSTSAFPCKLFQEYAGTPRSPWYHRIPGTHILIPHWLYIPTWSICRYHASLKDLCGVGEEHHQAGSNSICSHQIPKC
ncbi:hypothetical protein G6F17_013984 [Rhizopus arrhizus]|uniref:Uncharacterized protein n=1 Tax=Rhizopus oryzae TaxID=64495 RepID=A0A9P6WSA9_RHIOR|nr:hypothetical protein G6F20_013974 [Rhizopus arrhizus]KAG0833587.1 hypothetical protein G6F17_013984 [Rhizopus arrhizus]KAG0919329.1 hypothetical protein G6F32_016215 [Rhizopus arrhizus]KAG1137110.1 hypothetical protein G6F36_016117 [Rhizopus arrhizus]KAG1137116.1 hypothetical protein G6F36_016116 [Rhizopus arrhizus]